MQFRSIAHAGRALALAVLLALALALAAGNAAWASPAADTKPDPCKGKSTVPCKQTDLSITKKAKATGQDDFIFTITVKNNGTIAAENVVVTDSLSKRFELESYSGSCSGERTVRCKIGTLGAGKSATVTIHVDVEPDNFKGSIKNTASVSSKTKDPNSKNNSSSVTVKAQGKK